MSQDGVTLIARLRNPADEATLATLLGAGRMQKVPGLHFLSMFVIPPDADVPDAFLGLEANFDVDAGEFLPNLVAANGDLLHNAFSYCADYNGRGELLSYLQAADRRYQLFYVGCPGRTVRQIREERVLAARVDKRMRRLDRRQGRRWELVREVINNLSNDDRYRLFNIPQRPFWVRLALVTHPWRALYCVLQWLFFLAGVPTIIIVGAAAAASPVWPSVAPPQSVIDATWCWALVLGALFAAATLVWFSLLLCEFPAKLTCRTKCSVFAAQAWQYLRTSAGAVPTALALLGVLAFIHWHTRLLLITLAVCIGIVLLIALVLGAIWLVRLIRIGRREPGDQVDELTWDPELARLREREDGEAQNHFISVSTIRPGKLRMATLRAVLCWIHWLARILHNPRGLFNTQGIHFARWTILPGRRLLFVSNYDGSFGGYLGIFATLGAIGVSAIWGNTVGFPRTFLLFMDGARDEQRFKRRARASQVRTLLWYRRYSDLTVGAIERNAAIREELARFARGGLEVPEADYDAFLRRFSAPRP